ncbi:MAG: hypothetical protein HDR09_12885 [Lachnospiraceae bacterium]|nr:hypothetical protein [Lachnospiraceae bacterium]
MNNDKLVLKNGTKIEIESSQGIGALHTRVENISAACALWEKITAENLKQVTVENSAGMTVGRYSDMLLDHVEAKDNNDGSIQFTISLREKNTEENLSGRIEAVENSQKIQDGAIDEIGQIMSDILEGGTQ